MSKLTKCIMAVAIVVVLLWASNEDYKETVIYNMPNGAYKEIASKVGGSNSRIVKEYMSNKHYYDSLWQDRE